MLAAECVLKVILKSWQLLKKLHLVFWSASFLLPSRFWKKGQNFNTERSGKTKLISIILVLKNAVSSIMIAESILCNVFSWGLVHAKVCHVTVFDGLEGQSRIYCLAVIWTVTNIYVLFRNPQILFLFGEKRVSTWSMYNFIFS